MADTHHVFSIFGATGDLTNRKLLPALYFLEQENQLNENFRILCIARTDKSDVQYRQDAAHSIKKYSRIKVKESVLKRLMQKIHYQKVEFSNPKDYMGLREKIEKISGQLCHKCQRIYYLAVPASLFETIVQNLHNGNLAKKSKDENQYNRIMFEKPFGYDLESAQELNKSIMKVFAEKQVYRIDHYMAKELVQNLLVLRFANSIFEPLWNKEYIDHIQITVAETLGVETRGDYYEKSGAIRDVMQNHMMHLLTLVGMDAPISMSADHVKDEKVKVMKSINKIDKKDIFKISVIGQYQSGFIGGKEVVAYRDEEKVSNGSKTNTFAALKLEVNNKMWKGVPFYLRTGKRLKEKSTEIVIVYKEVPFGLFSDKSLQRNRMIIRVQPYEGITLDFNAKVPGNKLIIDDVTMDFCHECKFGFNSPEAYEKLIYDAMMGDQTLFTRWDEVENAWKLFDAFVSSTADTGPAGYESGTWGPKEADELIEKDGRKWVAPKRPAYADQIPK